ncbi:hypothetical protein [Myxococcus sp. RHSTA-1-4]|uniref:hypothetical protein n=1 Tax=Myxococcus sp. RHSTA-1-4 TaxID=2874601 RepID=UPI001CBB7909|nr:hypothetical protein [Myxococcus sp. RHSTA-1-4]MBZ4422616.1 hypothetical protein [Myxococcus sp. RHSTA-1-4]
MRHRLLPLSLLALLASGCERMPEDPIFVHGRLLHADGSPRADTPLRLERARVYSYGSSVPEEERDTRFKPYSEGASRASGDFTLEALAGDTAVEELNGYEQYHFRVVPPLDEDGHGVFVAFVFWDDVELPEMRPWDSGLTVSDGLQGPTLSFGAAPPVPQTPPSAKLTEYWDQNTNTTMPLSPSTPEPVMHLHGEGGLVWQWFRATSPWTPSPYVLEDFAGVEAQLRALSAGLWFFNPLGGESSTLDFRMEWRTPRKALPVGTLRPVSRGAACSPAPVEGPCPYTDGKLTVQETHPGSQQPGPGNEGGFGVEALTFTLNAPARPRRLVIRGLETTLNYLDRIRVVLEGSGDGDTWGRLADIPVIHFDKNDSRRNYYQYPLFGTDAASPFDPPMDAYTPSLYLDEPLTGDAPVRYLRLRVTAEDGESAGRLYSLAELSVFE